MNAAISVKSPFSHSALFGFIPASFDDMDPKRENSLGAQPQPRRGILKRPAITCGAEGDRQVHRPVHPSFRRAPDHSNCVFDASSSGFWILGALNRLDVFAAMRVAEGTPALPHPGCGFERFYEVDRRRDLPLVGIEIQTNINRLASLQARSFTIALPQWNARGATHRGYRAPICVAVERDLDRSAYFSKYSLGIEGEWDEAAV